MRFCASKFVLLVCGEMSNEVFIGVDGGGTKTVVICVDEQQNQLSRFVTGCTNHHSVGEEKASEELKAGILSALKEAHLSPEQGTLMQCINNLFYAYLSTVKSVCLGMSGIDRPEDHAIVNSWLRATFGEAKLKDLGVHLHNDAVVALVSGTKGDMYGIVVISGTGMIAVGYDRKGNTTRAGGWG